MENFLAYRRTGVNCRHSFTSFYPDVMTDSDDSYDSEINKRYYDMSQKQRAKERDIRDTKRRLTALQATGFTDEETAKRISNLQDSLKNKNIAYKDFCKENNLSMANWRTKI